MRYTQLATVKQRVAVGRPLPFNVLNNDRTLLLAKGQVIDGTAQLEALFERGTLVDLAELHRDADAIRQAPAALLPALWIENMDRVASVLQRSDSATFRGALDEAAEPVVALIDRDPDLAIFQVLRQEGNAHIQYGLNHSVHAAIVCRLVAQRLAWSPDEATRAFKAALTMNLGMLELQGTLAAQSTPPSEAQRRQILAHPIRSRDMLIQAGVTDADWLGAVEQHHMRPDGSGYPAAESAMSELASLLQRADIYTAKLSARSLRDPIAADRAGRQIFMTDPSNPVTAALVKEFGVYPPGSFVRLVNGESGVVVKRGPTVVSPVVAVLTGRGGEILAEPVRRDTTQFGQAIACIIPARTVRATVAPEKLMAIAA